MAEEIVPTEYWVRTEAGKVMGPLTFSTIELLAEQGVFGERCQASLDGLNFAFPGRFPELKEAFPASMWGSTDGPVVTAPAEAGGQRSAVPRQPPPSLRAPAPQPHPPVELESTPPPLEALAPAPAAAPVPPSGDVRPGPVGQPARAPAAPHAGVPLPELVPAGAIEGGTPFRLYYLAAATGGTGLLELEEPGGAVWELFFKKGNPELARTTSSGLDVGAWLVGKGALKPQQAAQAENSKGQFGGELLNALFAQGALDPGSAFTLLGEHAKVVLERALQVEAGRFRWNDAAPLPATTFPLGSKWSLLCGAGRKLDAASVARRLGERLDCPVMKAGDGLVALADLKLNAQESRVLGSFDGTRSLAELATDSPADAELLYRTAYFLGEVGFASFAATSRPRPADAPTFGRPAAAEEAPARGSAAAPAPGPAPAPIPPAPPSAKPAAAAAPAKPAVAPAPQPKPAATAAAAAAAAAKPAVGARPAAPAKPAAPSKHPSDLAGVLAFKARIADLDHFELLEVKRDATAAQLKLAYFALARSFHPDTAGADADPALRKAKEAITARLNEAYQLLSDEASRADYLIALSMGSKSGEVDVAAILAAEDTFQLASVMIKARKYELGLAQVEQAIALNPSEGEFYAWRAFARFCVAADKKAVRHDAEADLQKCLALNERCAIAYLFSARIASILGDSSGAIRHYQKCLELDEKNAEAQRELRLVESRKAK